VLNPKPGVARLLGSDLARHSFHHRSGIGTSLLFAGSQGWQRFTEYAVTHLPAVPFFYLVCQHLQGVMAIHDLDQGHVQLTMVEPVGIVAQG
jgi:hypothetical protein